jgi:hypothetical protein
VTSNTSAPGRTLDRACPASAGAEANEMLASAWVGFASRARVGDSRAGEAVSSAVSRVKMRGTVEGSRAWWKRPPPRWAMFCSRVRSAASPTPTADTVMWALAASSTSSITPSAGDWPSDRTITCLRRAVAFSS